METPPTAPPRQASIPPVIRWLMIVILPALGFVVGSTVLFGLIDPRVSLGALGVLLFLAGTTGAVLFLVVGLAVAPWLPAGEADAHAEEGDRAPAAEHPGGTWVGPGAAVLVGIAIGLAAGAGLMRESSYYYYESPSVKPFTPPALLCVLAAAIGVALLLAHRREGAEVAPLTRAPFHRVVFRCLLRATVGGLLAGLAGALVLWLVETRSSRVGPAALAGLLGASVVAAALSAAEIASWRAPARWRAPALLGLGAALPVVIVMTVAFVVELFQRGDAIHVTHDLLGELGDVLMRQPQDVLGTMVACAVPFALVGATRTGLLPYFGRRAPWPLVAQVPLAWLAGGLAVALVHLLVNDLSQRELRLFIGYLGVALPGLLCGMRLADPLEGRIAARWVLLTGGAR